MKRFNFYIKEINNIIIENQKIDVEIQLNRFFLCLTNLKLKYYSEIPRILIEIDKKLIINEYKQLLKKKHGK